MADKLNHDEQSQSNVAPPSYTPGPMAEQLTVTGTDLQRPPGVSYVVAQTGLPDRLHPHAYMFFSIFVAIFCGFFTILSLICSIPAIMMSAASRFYSKRGRYYRGKSFGNWAAGLSVCALIFGMLAEFVTGVLIACLVVPLATCGSHCDNYCFL